MERRGVALGQGHWVTLDWEHFPGPFGQMLGTRPMGPVEAEREDSRVNVHAVGDAEDRLETQAQVSQVPECGALVGLNVAQGPQVGLGERGAVVEDPQAIVAQADLHSPSPSVLGVLKELHDPVSVALELVFQHLQHVDVAVPNKGLALAEHAGEMVLYRGHGSPSCVGVQPAPLVGYRREAPFR